MRRSNKTRRFNTGKSIVLLILILVLFLLITGILIIGIDKIQGNDHEEYMKNYDQDVMRFDLYLNQGQYEFIPNENFWNRVHLYDDEKNEIDKQSIIISLQDSNLKFSEYVLTENAEYMKVNIDDINGWIKWTIPTLDEDSKVFIRSFISKSGNDNSIEVFPFNDDNFILIYTNAGAKILDLNNKKINWFGGGYYESVKVDIYSDTISCKGDLSSKTYYFNKYGEELDKNLKVIKN